MEIFTWEAWPMWLVFSALIVMVAVIAAINTRDSLRDSKTKKEKRQTLRVITSDEATAPGRKRRAEQDRIAKRTLLENALEVARQENPNSFDGEPMKKRIHFGWMNTDDRETIAVKVNGYGGTYIIATVTFLNEFGDTLLCLGNASPSKITYRRFNFNEMALELACYVQSYGHKSE